MEVRCGKCNKLFRVSDDKITGTGIRFTCSKCGEYVKITKEEFEKYKASSPAASSVAASATSPVATAKKEPGQAAATTAASAASDLSSALPSILGHDQSEEDSAKSKFSPSPASSLSPDRQQSKPAASGAKTTVQNTIKKTEAAAAPASAKPVQTVSKSEAVPSHEKESRPAPRAEEKISVMPAFEPVPASGGGKKAFVFIILLLVVVAGAFFGARWYRETRAGARAPETANQIMVPDGLTVVNPSGSIDAATGDLVVTGTVQNTTDKPKPAWYVVVEVYDAQNTTIAKGKILNGKQVYTHRDYDILAKRGVNLEDFKQKNLNDPGTVIPANGTSNFELRLMEPPAGIASFNATLQPFDPEQLYKEIAEEQK